MEHERLATIHAPIGLEIGAETPEEIAVSIAAELVASRRDVEAGGSLRDRERIVERFLADNPEDVENPANAESDVSAPGSSTDQIERT